MKELVGILIEFVWEQYEKQFDSPPPPPRPPVRFNSNYNQVNNYNGPSHDEMYSSPKTQFDLIPKYDNDFKKVILPCPGIMHEANMPPGDYPAPPPGPRRIPPPPSYAKKQLIEMFSVKYMYEYSVGLKNEKDGYFIIEGETFEKNDIIKLSIAKHKQDKIKFNGYFSMIDKKNKIFKASSFDYKNL